MFTEMGYAVLSGERLATERMSETEKLVVQELGDTLKVRHLMKEYHLKYWEIDEVPYQVLDQMLKLDRIENAVIEDGRKGKT